MPIYTHAKESGQGADTNWQYGIDYFTSILTYPCQLSEAIAEATTLLTNAAEGIGRLLIVGQQIWLKPMYNQ